MLQKHFCGEGSHHSLSYKKSFSHHHLKHSCFVKWKLCWLVEGGCRLQWPLEQRVSSGDISKLKPFLRLYCPLSDVSLALSHIVCNWKSWWRTRKCMIICFPWDFWNCQWVQLCGVYNLSLRDGLYQRPWHAIKTLGKDFADLNRNCQHQTLLQNWSADIFP